MAALKVEVNLAKAHEQQVSLLQNDKSIAETKYKLDL